MRQPRYEVIGVREPQKGSTHIFHTQATCSTSFLYARNFVYHIFHTNATITSSNTCISLYFNQVQNLELGQHQITLTMLILFGRCRFAEQHKVCGVDSGCQITQSHVLRQCSWHHSQRRPLIELDVRIDVEHNSK